MSRSTSHDGDAFAEPCLNGDRPRNPGRANRKQPVAYDIVLYKQRNVIERVFSRLNDWWRIATRYDRCAHTFFNATCTATTVIFRL